MSGLLTAFTALPFGLLILFKSTDRKLAHVWFCFSLTVTVWGLCSFTIGYSQNPEVSLIVWEFAYALGVLWVAPLFYHFVCIFSGTRATRSLLIHYVVGFLFFLIVPTKLFISDIHFLFGSFYYISAGSAFPLFFMWWIGLVIYSHIELVSTYHKARLEKQNQIKYFFLATTIGFMGAILCAPPIFGIDVYPWSNFGIPLYPLIMAYAILKYRLMDIHIFFKRAGLMILVYAALLLISVPSIFAFHKHLAFNTIANPSIMVTEVIILGIVLSIGPFIYAYIVRQSSLFNEDTIASLTHELKSPLASVEGAFDYLVEAERENTLTANQKESYQVIVKRNLSRLIQSIDELIQVMQFQHAKGTVKKVDKVNLVMMIDQIVKKHESMLRMKNLKINFECDPMLLVCDAAKIEQVISNILSNAIKFSEQGTISISTNATANEIIISIKDQGKGISTSEAGKIFDRFYQGSKNKTAKGTGIGLTIAKTW